MTTLSRTFDTVSARDSEARRSAWEARGAARDARFRSRAVRVLWLLGGIAALAAMVL